MLKTMVGYSTNSDGFKQGLESMQMFESDIKDSKINFLFSSVNSNTKDVMAGIKSVSDAPTIGCTTSGKLIVPDGVISSEDGFSGVFSIMDSNLVVGVAAHESGKNARDIGRKVAIEAVENAKTTRAPAYFYMVASPKDEEDYLAGIEDIIGRVPFFGGSGADDTYEGKWKIFCNEKEFTDGVAVAFFYTDNEFVTELNGYYRETNNVGIITDSDNRVLNKIDNKKAIDVYKDWTSARDADISGLNLFNFSSLHPLGVKDITGNITLVRNLVKSNEDDSITVGNKIIEKTACTLLESTNDELIDACGEIVKEVNEKMYVDSSGYLMFHGASRVNSIGDRIDEVYKELLNETNGLPFMCIFTFGEYGYSNNSANYCGSSMLSLTGFGRN